jgi:hypothetical protein
MKTYDAYMAHPAGGERVVQVFDGEGDTTVVTVVWIDECGKTRFMHEYRHNLNPVLVTEDETMTTYQITERVAVQVQDGVQS